MDAGRPRWKILVELAIGLLGILLGAHMMSRGFDLDNMRFQNDWWWFFFGLVVLIAGMTRTGDRWDEL